MTRLPFKRWCGLNQMTDRKPHHQTWPSFVEQQIADAVEKGAFENLPGFGKPLEFGQNEHDENWWLKDKLRREQISALPPALAIRLDVQQTLLAVEGLTDETEVQSMLAALNGRIQHAHFASSLTGPPSTTMPVDVPKILRRWQERRGILRRAGS